LFILIFTLEFSSDPQKLTFQPCVDLWLSCH